MSTETLSDYNVSGQKSAIVSKRRQYSDIDLSLIPHPNKKDIIPLTDVDAVKQSIKNLIMTGRYERPFQPNLSSGVRSILFEQADSITTARLRIYIEDVIRDYEPRVDDVEVIVEDDADNNAYYVTIAFNVIAYQQQSDVTIYLERLR